MKGNASCHTSNQKFRNGWDNIFKKKEKAELKATPIEPTYIVDIGGNVDPEVLLNQYAIKE